LGRCKQKQCWLRGLLCCWPSITEWRCTSLLEGPRLRNDLYCVEWDVKLYYTIPYFVRRSESSQELSFPGAKVPTENFRSRERKVLIPNAECCMRNDSVFYPLHIFRAFRYSRPADKIDRAKNVRWVDCDRCPLWFHNVCLSRGDKTLLQTVVNRQ